MNTPSLAAFLLARAPEGTPLWLLLGLLALQVAVVAWAVWAAFQKPKPRWKR